jgi:hypothetical protein
MLNLYQLPTPEQQGPLASYEALPVYVGNAFNSLVQDLNLSYPTTFPAGSEPFQYTNRYGGTSYYLYGPGSDSGDKLTEKEVSEKLIE